MNREPERKPTMMRMIAAAIALSIFLTALFLGGRLMQYGFEKVARDWYYYAGFFVFSFFGLVAAMLIVTKASGGGK